MQELVFLAGAERDVFAIHAELLETGDLHAAGFADRLDYRMSQLQMFPKLGPPFDDGIRRLVLGKVPYSVFYTIHGSRILVQAILHQRTSRSEIQRRLPRSE